MQRSAIDVWMPAAIYARYSTDKQDARSTEDQIRRCRRFAESQGFRVVAVYEDHAVSGASAMRVELQRMLADARQRGGSPFKAVLVDDQSRLARDLGTAWRLIFEELPPLGIKVVDCTTGRASDETGARLTFGVTALMNDAFLEMVRAETHRGLEGRALGGFATGGRCFGYDTRKEPNPPDPEHPRSEIFVNLEEARLVVRIFRAWIDGSSFKEIAQTFNDEGIPAPHDGGTGHKGNRGWIPTTIRSMLMNERYLGKLVWNKTKWIKDRTTGKRRNVPNPREEWVTIDRPDLRIIDDHVFAEAQARFHKRKESAKPIMHTKSKSLLAGLLRCSKCTGSMTVVGSKRANGVLYKQYGCTTHYSRGASICTNKMTISEAKAIEMVTGGIRAVFTKPTIVEDLTALYDRHAAIAEKKADAEDALGHQLAAAERKVKNLYEAVAKLELTDSLREAIKQAEADVLALRERASRDRRRGKLISHPTRIRAFIDNLLATLNREPQAARALLLKHVGRVPLRPTEEGYRWDGEFVMDGEAICSDPENRRSAGQPERQTPDPAGLPQRDSQVSQGSLVAGAGFEPTTFGL